MVESFYGEWIKIALISVFFAHLVFLTLKMKGNKLRIRMISRDNRFIFNDVVNKSKLSETLKGGGVKFIMERSLDPKEWISVNNLSGREEGVFFASGERTDRGIVSTVVIERVRII